MIAAQTRDKSQSTAGIVINTQTSVDSVTEAAEELAKSIQEPSAQTHSARELTNKTAEVKSLAQQTACRGAIDRSRSSARSAGSEKERWRWRRRSVSRRPATQEISKNVQQAADCSRIVANNIVELDNKTRENDDASGQALALRLCSISPAANLSGS